MATAESVKVKLQRLIDDANATTGAADTTLTAAVNTLKSGYGSSGGDKTSFTYTWRGTSYKFYFLPGQTWDEWFTDTTHANKDYTLINFYSCVVIAESADSDDEGNDVADKLCYPDTGVEVMFWDIIQPIDYGVIYWDS